MYRKVISILEFNFASIVGSGQKNLDIFANDVLHVFGSYGCSFDSNFAICFFFLSRLQYGYGIDNKQNLMPISCRLKL
jgi:hypothetical protein